METTLIDIQNLSKTYKGAIVASVNGLSFQLAPNKISGLLGPNGAGKTTTISIICGLLPFDDGAVTVLGHNIKTQKPEILKIIGIVPQQIALYNKLNALENLRYFGKLYGLKNPYLNTRIDELLEEFGLSQHAKKEVGYYSGADVKHRIRIHCGFASQTVGFDTRRTNGGCRCAIEKHDFDVFEKLQSTR